jgi:exodeoxyribonuclease VII large subunit
MQLKNQRPDVNSARTQVNELRHRLQQCQRHALSQQRQQLSALQTQLELLNPQRTLDRGYAIIRDHKGKLLRSTHELHPQSLVSIRLANGSADVGISSVQTSLDQ